MIKTFDNGSISLLFDNNKEIWVRLGERFRDRGWATYIGNIQHSLRITTANKLILYADKCSWIDPGPLLSLCIAIAQWLAAGKKLELHLPDIENCDDDQKGFIAFLAKEGFLDSIFGHGKYSLRNEIEIMVGDGKLATDFNKLKSDMEKLSPDLAYKNATCIPAQVRDLSEFRDITLLIDELIDHAKNKGLKRHFPNTIDNQSSTDAIYVQQELRQILTEFVQNIMEHAYSNESTTRYKFAGIYARTRYGLCDGRQIDAIHSIKKYFDQEEVDCPQLNLCGALKQVGFLEVFISDAGKGITHDCFKTGCCKENRVHPLKVFFQKISTNDACSVYKATERQAQGRSPLPGLKYVSDMLASRNGFMRIACGKEWNGGVFPLDFEQKPKIQYSVTCQTIKDYPQVIGTHVLVRLSHGNPLVLPGKWKAASLKNITKAHEDPIIQSLSKIGQPPEIWSKCIFEVYDDQVTKWKNQYITKSKAITVGSKNRPYHAIIWRPPNSLHRNQLLVRLKELTASKIRSHIIIVDQDLASAFMTSMTLEGLRNTILPNVKRISILSDTFCSADLVSEGRSFYLSLFPMLLGKIDDGIHLGHIIFALREIDSEFFWDNILESEHPISLYINDKVLWDNQSGESISGYLNFLHSINNKACRRIYRRVLSIFLAYISPEETPRPIDHIVEPLLNGFNFRQNHKYSDRSWTVLGRIFL